MTKTDLVLSLMPKTIRNAVIYIFFFFMWKTKLDVTAV